jgi:queuosine biosynthesis protein QueD
VGEHVLRTDGASRGNPGPASAAYELTDASGIRVSIGSRCIGEATNNVAEYEAVLWGLDSAREAGVDELVLLTDSELVVKQLTGDYRVKDDKLKPLHARAVDLIGSFEEFSVRHVPRDENAIVDQLANEALDEASHDGSSSGAERPSAGGSFELTVKSHFDAAHALVGYPGECKELHGHTWDIEITVEGAELDDVGIVYDFKRLKEDLGAVLEPWDHAFLNEVPPFDEVNPTAENLAREIHDRLTGLVGAEVRVVEVAVWESPIARIAYRRAD